MRGGRLNLSTIGRGSIAGHQYGTLYRRPPGYNRVNLGNGGVAPQMSYGRPRGNLVSVTGNLTPSAVGGAGNLNPNLGGGGVNNGVVLMGSIFEFYMVRFSHGNHKLGGGADNELYSGGQAILQPPSTYPTGRSSTDLYGDSSPYTVYSRYGPGGTSLMSWENIYNEYGNRIAVRGDSTTKVYSSLHLDDYSYDGNQDGDTVTIEWTFSVAWPTVTDVGQGRGKNHIIDYGESTSNVIFQLWGKGDNDQYYLAFETVEEKANLGAFSNYSAIQGGRNSYVKADNGDTGSGAEIYNGIGTATGYGFARDASGANGLSRNSGYKNGWNGVTYIVLGWADGHQVGYTFRPLQQNGIILSCFGGNTPVSLADGTSKEIKYIKKGDKVKSYDIENKKVVDSTVTDNISHYHKDGYLIINDKIVVSYEHVMYINDKWQDAKQAKPGDHFTDINQNKVKIDKIIDVKKPIVLYDISITDGNFYAHDILVHNKSVVQPPTAPPPPPQTSCFTGDTRITMSDGAVKHIKDVEVGDEVLGYDTNTSETISSRVVKTFTHPNTEGYLVVNDSLNVTPEHPVYDGSEWKPIGHFGIHDSLQTVYGNKKSIDKIEWCNNIVTTYNLEVESEHHNYFANDCLVHNKTIIQPPPPPTTSCFTGDTRITMSDGSVKHIKDVDVGDEVLGYDTNTSETISSKVVETFEHPNTEGYLVVNDNLNVTPEHPMYDGSEWKPIGHFGVLDSIQTIHGNKQSIDKIEWCNDIVTTYNLEVESEHHNYFANDCLVHNKSWVQPPNPPPTTSCFLKGTKITLSDSSVKLIENINCGDKVLSYDTKNNIHVESTVTNITCHPKTKSYLIVNNGDLRATSNHEMYNGTEWLPLDQFKVGDTIQNINGKLIKINSIENRNIESTTFDLTVDSDHHNYYANEFLAHNKTIVQPPTCFTGNTLITLSNGKTKPINRIKIRDKVLVYDFDQRKNVESTVVKTEYHADIDEYFVINDDINVTPEHLIYTGKDWIAVRDLVLTDKIQTINGELKPVKSVERMFKRVCVYNFHVDNKHHNYYANGYLVHNSKTVNPPPNPPPPPVGPPGGPGGGGGGSGGGGTNPIGGISSQGVYMGSTDSNDVHKLRLVNTYTPLNSSACTSLIEVHAKFKDSSVDFVPGTVTTVDLDLICTGILNKQEKLIGLSEFRKKISNPFTDTFNVSGYEVCNSFTTSFPLCTVPAGDHQLLQLFVKRYQKNYMLDDGKIREGTLSSQAYDALNGKISVGNIRYDAVNKVVKSVSLSSDIVFTGFGRSLTAAYLVGSDEYRAYVPTTAWGVPLNPLYNDGAAESVTEFIRQSGSLPNNVVDAGLFELEWPHKPGQNYLPIFEANGVQFDGGKIGDSIAYYDTPNPLARLMPLTAQDLYNIYGQASINRTLARSGTRFNLSGPTNGIYSHADRSSRRYTLHNKQSIRQIQTVEGYPFGVYTTALSGKYYAFTKASYPGSTVPSVTSDRISTESGNVSGWDISKFEDFTSLSAIEFYNFLIDQGKLSYVSPITSQQGVVEPLGYVTFNNSLTASDGSYYIAALTRCTVPSWVQVADEIGGSPRPSGSDPVYANFVICTSGHDLVLPYITTFDTASL